MNWTNGYHFVSSNVTVPWVVEINGTTYHVPLNQSLGYWFNTVLPTLQSDVRVSASEDNYFYYVQWAGGGNIRMKVYTSDGSAIFTTPVADVSNPTYQELPGRDGFQVCLIPAV